MRLFRFAFTAMASPNTVQLWAADEADARRAADAAIADVARIEAKYSRYRNDSLTAQINRSAGAAAVPIDPETAALLRYADRCHALSGGRFDLTSGALRKAWNFGQIPPRLPDEATLAAARARVGWPDVEWNEGSIRLPRPGMEIDFGGIGKEYAADRAAALGLEHGIAHGLVNLGGDVRVIGPQPDGAPWRVGISHPRPAAGGATAAIAGIDLADGAVATSGDYQRFMEIDGRRYCHLLDARTGRPVECWQSISVVAPMCVVAGSCATIAMLLQDDALPFLDAQGLDYLAIAADGTTHRSARAAAGTTCIPFPDP
jgi:thiamine biosynthesis lipoprotein